MPKAPNFSQPVSMVQQIHQALSRAIINGELPPGSPMKEQELQKYFGVSRAPIREAIRLLESEGLVVVKAFKEKYVRKLEPEELQETFTVLACLEGFAASLAAPSITEKELDLLDTNQRQMEEAYQKGDLALCTQLNFDFHRTVTLAAGNSVLRTSISAIMKRSGWHWLNRVYFNNLTLVPATIAEHESILKALKARNPEEAEKAVRAHLIHVRANWRDQMLSEEQRKAGEMDNNRRPGPDHSSI